MIARAMAEPFARKLSLSEVLGVPTSVIEFVRSRVRASYSDYPVPKRNGGVRFIEAPDSALKAMQRRLLDKLLYRITPHSAAHGFCTGRNICTHASRHSGKAWVVTVDIEDFFPSVKREMLEHLPGELELSEREGKCLLDLVTRNGRLPQGAPTSPHLGNIVMRRVDAELANEAVANRWSYSRYADDLVMSGDGNPQVMLEVLRRSVAGAGFRTNRRKCRMMGRHRRQWVTGLVVNEGIKLPRELRRKLRAAGDHMNRGTFRGDIDATTGLMAFHAFVGRSEAALHAAGGDEYAI